MVSVLVISSARFVLHSSSCSRGELSEGVNIEGGELSGCRMWRLGDSRCAAALSDNNRRRQQRRDDVTTLKANHVTLSRALHVTADAATTASAATAAREVAWRPRHALTV